MHPRFSKKVKRPRHQGGHAGQSWASPGAKQKRGHPLSPCMECQRSRGNPDVPPHPCCYWGALASSSGPRSLPLPSIHGPPPWKGHWRGTGYCQGGGQGQACLESPRPGSRLRVGVGGKPSCPSLPLVPTSACLLLLQQRLPPSTRAPLAENLVPEEDAPSPRFPGQAPASFSQV